jgi:uncharacterized protein HemY
VDTGDAQIDLAGLHADHGRLDEAALILEAIIKADAGNGRATVALAKVYIHLKRLDDAIRVIGDTPKDPAAMAVLGTVYLKKRDFDRARTIFEEVALADECAAEARLNLAAIYARLGQPAKAASYMASVLTKVPL